MPRAFRIFAFIMTAIWLPATLHCALDRAGMLPSAPVCCADEARPVAAADQCGTRCEMLDNGTYQAASDAHKIAAPTLLPSVLCLAEPTLTPDIVTPISPPKADTSAELIRTWHFVARAALPPRAP